MKRFGNLLTVAILLSAILVSASLITAYMFLTMPAIGGEPQINGSYVLDVRDTLKNDVKITVKRADGSIEVY